MEKKVEKKEVRYVGQPHYFLVESCAYMAVLFTVHKYTGDTVQFLNPSCRKTNQ